MRAMSQERLGFARHGQENQSKGRIDWQLREYDQTNVNADESNKQLAK